MLMLGRVAGLIGVAAGLALAWPAQAAEIRVGKAGGAAAILVYGTFAYGDGERFEQLSTTLPKGTTVMFDSAGGNLLAGLKIGETMRARGFSSLVGAGSVCASSCAIAWLGGTRRYLSSGGRLGFHAASGDEGVSAPGNALVGAYMARLGLKQEAVYALTAASPYDIAWLDFASARTLGIAVEPYVGPSLASAPAAPVIASRDAPSYQHYRPSYAAPVSAPVSSGRSTRACPAYTYGGHGGC